MDDLNAQSSAPQSLTDGDYRRLADFRRALRGFFAFSKEAVGSVGLAPAQYQALLAIRAREGQGGEYTIGDLAEELYIRHHSAVELVDRLEKAGLIVRKPAAKGRRVIPLLTPEARAILAQLAQMHLAQLRRYAPEMARHLWTGEGGRA
jgi:DNA-binding MarR family transcriptional regulator